jgi:hypothetical protein
MECYGMSAMSHSLIYIVMADYNENGGKWGQNTALWAIVVVILVVLAIWLCNKTGQDKADLAASVQKLYGHVECIAPQLNKYAERVDAIGNAVTRVSQAQADFQSYAASMITDLDNAVFAPRCGCNRGGCGCGTDKFVKSTEYTAGATTLVETDTCRS